MKLRTWFTVAAVVFILTLVGAHAFYTQDAKQFVQLNGHAVYIDVADTAVERAQGLSGRESLAEDEGMLFIFPEDGVYSFWMKDMAFAIDILWISRAGEIVDLRANVSPDTFPSTFEPRRVARYVLELPAGAAEEYGARIGDVVRLGSLGRGFPQF